MRSFTKFSRRWMARTLLTTVLTGGVALAQDPPAPLVPLLNGVDPAAPVPAIPKKGEQKSVLPKVDVPALAPEAKPTPLPAVPALKPIPATEPATNQIEPPLAKTPEQANTVPELKPIPELKAIPELKPTPELPSIPDLKAIPEIKPVPEVKPIPEIKPVPEVKPTPELPSLPTSKTPLETTGPETLPMPRIRVREKLVVPDLPIPVPPITERIQVTPPAVKLPPIEPKPEPPKPEPKPVLRLPDIEPKKVEPKKEGPLAPTTVPTPIPTPTPTQAPVTPLPLGAPPVQPNPEAKPIEAGPVAPTTVPEAKDTEKKPTPACAKRGFDFSKTPQHVRPQPRPGFFPVLPAGRGYYSFLDLAQNNCREAPPKIPFSRFGLMPQGCFDADWRYLDDPKNTDKDIADILKRMPLGCDFMLSVGGSSWIRYMQEENSRLTRTQNDYTIYRSRAYADLWYKDLVRVYVEGIFADTTRQALAPLPIDSTGFDLLNAFVDVKLVNFDDKPLYLRAGRQELLLGSQRLVSTLDWANTRRTFEGARLTRTGEKWDFDAFWLRPVLTNPVQFDSRDHNVDFYGAWASYRPDKNTVIDMYDMILDNRNNFVQSGLQRGQFTLNTLGARYAGAKDNGILWDVEGAFQSGTQQGTNVTAGMATAGVGHNAKKLPWSPAFWAFYDWASGTDNPGGNASHTFNQLFPFGHYYFGWADQVGRQNIHDLNFHLYAYPAKWVTLWAQFHSFWLNSARDGLYNAGGNIIRRDATGRSGIHVGNEVDLVANFHLTNRDDLTVGYSYLFGGEFLRNTSTNARSVDTSLFFMMYSLRW